MRCSLSGEKLSPPEAGIFNFLKGQAQALKIDSDYIKLDSFLKAVNAAASGGDAKMMITGGAVRVNGEIETRRGRKLYPGDRVEIAKRIFVVE